MKWWVGLTLILGGCASTKQIDECYKWGISKEGKKCCIAGKMNFHGNYQSNIPIMNFDGTCNYSSF